MVKMKLKGRESTKEPREKTKPKGISHHPRRSQIKKNSSNGLYRQCGGGQQPPLKRLNLLTSSESAAAPVTAKSTQYTVLEGNSDANNLPGDERGYWRLN